MKAASVAAPGIAWGAYPERHIKERNAWSELTDSIQSAFAPFEAWTARGHRRFVAQVQAHATALRAPDFTQLQRKATDLRARLARDGFPQALVAESFALIREFSQRLLGRTHFDTQLIAGWIMLSNRLAEMQTGEGKTLSALLPAATAAMAGIPVHVITANEYLVKRDAELLRPVYEALGLTVETVTQPLAAPARHAAYSSDVVYCTAKELVFDYLRDRLTMGPSRGDLAQRVEALKAKKKAAPRPLLRGLCMALIDEADSILIDEARTPLILSQSRANPQQSAYHEEALDLARELRAERDFQLIAATKAAQLTDQGRELLTSKSAPMGGMWQDCRRREEVVSLALGALHLFLRDREYIVRDGRVHIIDQTTGRVAEGRVWSRGLQQLIEIKEGCKPSGEQSTVAQITYQRFFPRYLRLGGMSGTLTESRGELRSVYRLGMARVPLRLPSRRAEQATRVFATSDAKWRVVVERIVEVRSSGQPVLVGTDSVADSESLSRRLDAVGVPHTVLNARHDAAEAEIVARAGEVGCVTVATNMAGRGTDIPLGPGAKERGGLHVISCQHNSSARIDRQLRGRCARQGDPGSAETILCLEDALISRYLPAFASRLLARGTSENKQLPALIGRMIAVYPQWVEERRQRIGRWHMLKQDATFERRLSFSGPAD